MNKNSKKSRLWFLFGKKQKQDVIKKPEISLSKLKSMVKTKQQEDILKLIEDETIPSVRDAWIDYFLDINKRIKYKNKI